MTRDIRPLRQDDLDELSRFLISGFGAAADADFAAPEVLRWKYLEPTGEGRTAEPRSLIARDESGAVVGHLGFCPTAFVWESADGPGGRVPALHMIDWLGSPNRRGVGVSLMRAANATAPVQFGLGGSRAGRDVAERSGYELLPSIHVYQRILRPVRWLRRTGSLRGAARVGRDLAGRLRNAPAAPRALLHAAPVASFGVEVADVARRAALDCVLTERTPDRLNHFLRFPRQAMSGFGLLDPAGRMRGFAVLNRITQPKSGIVVGKIVDCLLDEPNPEPWHAAFVALAGELARQGADVAEAYAGTPWTAAALRAAGFAQRHPLDFHLRDPNRLIPRDRPFHFSPVEADYAYT